MISEGLLKLERVQVICPACGQQVEAVVKDGRVKGYCAVANQYVDFLVERQGRDSKGHFIKGNVPWNKRRALPGETRAPGNEQLPGRVKHSSRVLPLA